MTRSASDAERQVDVEDPAPREVVDEEAAEQRADDRRDAEDRAEEPLVAAAVARRDDVADRRRSSTTMSPPAPSPWSARNAISSVMFWAMPQSAEPTRKMTIAVCRTILRPYRSPSLPYSGPVTVDASRYAVTTHERWLRPPRSPTIVGSAVDDDRLVERREQDDEHERAEDDALPRRLLSVVGIVPSMPKIEKSEPERVARGADAGAVPRPAPEGHRGAVHRRVRPRLRAGHVSLRRLRRGAVRVGREVRLGLRLAGVLRAEGRGRRRGGDGREPRHGAHRGAVRELRRPSRPRVPRRAAPDRACATASTRRR